ncbi:MAG TPA: FHA domain-containing protein [Candidatus Cloacimonadota bacterium]|nr:FHA domain-containing protein [Candidatus Cloacimonadota bacterium]
MNCPKCKTVNSDGMLFCRKCGTPLNPQYKVCPNGHNYPSDLDLCPHCPTNRAAEAYDDTDGLDKTRIDSSAPQMAGGDKAGWTIGRVEADRDKTVIMNPPKTSVPSATEQPAIRKLTGWLVTFDLQASGVDFRLYMGRHLIGRGARCDIVLQVPGVSEEHAVLLNRDGKFILQDNLSANGTYVNGEAIDDKRVLRENDVITIAGIKLKLKLV